MSDTISELSLETSRTIAAPREKLFDAWLNPDMLARFMTPGENMSVPRATTDPKVGGRFSILMRAGDNDMPHEGTYKVIDRPNRLSFTWESMHSTIENSTVTIDFDEVPEGTRVTLRHVRFENEGMRDNHQKGWAAILDALAKAA